jgi:hypothetical protein
MPQFRAIFLLGIEILPFYGQNTVNNHFILLRIAGGFFFKAAKIRIILLIQDNQVIF